jgi:competence protein ComGC
MDRASLTKEGTVQAAVKAVSWSGVMTKTKESFKSKHAGLTLVEMALVLALIGLLGWLFLPPTFQMQEKERIKETQAKLDAIEAALVRFVMLNERLPCPADGTLRDDNSRAGVADDTPSGCSNSSLINPVVPWRSLGLTAKDAVDGWGVRITYRPWTDGPNGPCSLTGSSLSLCGSYRKNELPFASRPATDQPPPPASASCPVSGPVLGSKDWCSLLRSSNLGHSVECRSPTCSVVLANPNPPSGQIPTGAAYVLISHGPNRCGGYLPSGQYLDIPSQCQGAPGGQGEQQNRNNFLPPSNYSYVDAPFSDSADNTHFDDIVRWRPIMAVAVEARKVQ